MSVWPAKFGLYTPKLFAQMAAERCGVGLLTVFEEMFWGDAGIALSILYGRKRFVHVRDWVHEFAEEVIRPAAAERDEREETPWPIIAETTYQRCPET